MIHFVKRFTLGATMTLFVGAASLFAQDPCQTVNFDKDSENNPLLAGTPITEQFSEWGLSISVINQHSDHPQQGIIFDSAHPSGGDSDLGTPGSKFGGPGKGKGGEKGVGANKEALGNILIIAENFKDENKDGLADEPDDEAKGGKIALNFNRSVSVEHLQMVDIDDGSGATLIVFGQGNEAIKTIEIPGHGNNSVSTVEVNAKNVTKIVVNLPGSGGLAEIRYCYE